PGEMVPIVASPPVTPLTAQVTAVVGTPPSVAWNWIAPFCQTAAVAGVTARALPTVKIDGDVAVFAPTVTVIDPVVAPVGTEVSRRFGAATVTVASVPLKRTVLPPGVSLKPFPKICTAVPISPRPGLTSVMPREP